MSALQPSPRNTQQGPESGGRVSTVNGLASYDHFERRGPLTDDDLRRIPSYVRAPMWAKLLGPREIKALGANYGIHLSPFARVRWPGSHHPEPTAAEARAYLESFVDDPRWIEKGVPFPYYFQRHTVRSDVARFIRDYSWRDPKTGEWPVRWPTKRPLGKPPVAEFWQNRSWHIDAGNASITWPIEPLAAPVLWARQIGYLQTHPDYQDGEGAALKVAFIDNTDLIWGGGGAYRPCVFGPEFEARFLDMLRQFAAWCRLREIYLVVNGLPFALPQEIWDLPDGLYKEYGFDQDTLTRTARRMSGRPYYCKGRQLNEADCHRIRRAGGRVVSTWPGESRPAAWFREETG